MNDETKKKRIIDDITLQKQGLQKLEEAHTIVKNDIGTLKKIAENIVVTKDYVRRGIALDELLLSYPNAIDEGKLQEYTRIEAENQKLFESFCNLPDDIEQFKTITPLAITTATLSSASGSAASSAIHVFSDVQDSQFQEELRHIWLDTIEVEIESIKKDLVKIDPQLVLDFEKLIRDWHSTHDMDKYKVLIELRSILFHRLLDRLCPIQGQGSLYCKTSWCRNGIKGREFQIKFFMIGYYDENHLSKTTLITINNIAKDFQTLFNEMSEKGKQGTNGKEADRIIRDVITSLNKVLINRKGFFKSTP